MSKKPKSAQGLMARGAKGAPREKLAKAAGYRSDAEIAAQFPLKRQKQVRQLQQSLAELASGLSLDDRGFAAVAHQYDMLIRSLLGQPVTSQPPKQVEMASCVVPAGCSADKGV